MVWAPISELPAVGRSPVYVVTLVVFVFFQFAVIYAKNFGMLLAFRFLTGFLGSPVLATGGASLGDMWNARVRDYMIAIWGCFAVSAPVLGPLVGGFAFSAKGWTWTIWELLWISGFALVLLFFLLPETFAPNILSRRARRIRRITGDQKYASEAEIEIARVAPRVSIESVCSYSPSEIGE
jgi:DHA1 family multidrug resistance protein-like MFS transporter